MFHCLNFRNSKQFLLIVLCVLLPFTVSANEINEDYVRTLAQKQDITKLRQSGQKVLPLLAQMYKSSSEDQRTVIAWIFYSLGWKSPEAAEVLMADINTKNQNLRLQVQWALGRVSSDDEVVEALLKNLQFDPNPLFRDKAACALAYDQIHLKESQKVRLYEGLILALRDPKIDVRKIALQALQIHTGQTKGFNPDGTTSEREAKVEEWEAWLKEYKSNL